jgi:hypothetical protein
VQAVKQEMAQDRSERNAKQKEKEFQKNYTTNLKVELGQFFYNYFKNSEDVGQALADLQKIENRENIIKGVFNSHTQKHGDRGKTQLNYMYEQELARIYKIFKNAAPKNQDDYKKQIALEKWDMQRQRELLKIKQLKQKIAQNEQKYNMRQAPKQPAKTSGNGGEVAKVLLYLMFAPIAIFGLIIYGFISAAAKTK